MPSYSDFIGIDVAGIDEIEAALRALPDEVVTQAMDAVGDYFIDVLHQYPPQKRVSRRQAYGVPFFTRKQRRYFFAALREGKIKVPYHRTQGLRNAWQKMGEGHNMILVNAKSYADIVYGEQQSRMMKIIGWDKLQVIVQEHLQKALVKVDASVRKTLRRLRLD